MGVRKNFYERLPISISVVVTHVDASHAGAVLDLDNHSVIPETVVSPVGLQHVANPQILEILKEIPAAAAANELLHGADVNPGERRR